MARQLRIEYPGAFYHITARGNERRPIFFDDEDRGLLLKLFHEAKIRYSVRIYSYVFMPNHYHLLIETNLPNLSNVMHFIQTKYTVYYNFRHKRVGHLFQGRFKALLVDKDNYLLELVRYIHLNPIRSKIASSLENYKWSSFNEYIYKSDLIDSKLIMDYFNEDKLKFSVFHLEGLSKKWEDISDKIYGSVLIGSKTFTDTIKQKLKQTVLNKEISGADKLREEISKENLTKILTDYFKIQREELLLKKGRWNDSRKIGIYLFRKYTDMPLNLIGKLFGGVTGTAVSQIVKKIESLRSVNQELNKTLEKIECRIKT